MNILDGVIETANQQGRMAVMNEVAAMLLTSDTFDEFKSLFVDKLEMEAKTNDKTT